LIDKLFSFFWLWPKILLRSSPPARNHPSFIREVYTPYKACDRLHSYVRPMIILRPLNSPVRPPPYFFLSSSTKNVNNQKSVLFRSAQKKKCEMMEKKRLFALPYSRVYSLLFKALKDIAPGCAVALQSNPLDGIRLAVCAVQCSVPSFFLSFFLSSSFGCVVVLFNLLYPMGRRRQRNLAGKKKKNLEEKTKKRNQRDWIAEAISLVGIGNGICSLLCFSLTLCWSLLFNQQKRKKKKKKKKNNTWKTRSDWKGTADKKETETTRRHFPTNFFFFFFPLRNLFDRNILTGDLRPRRKGVPVSPSFQLTSFFFLSNHLLSEIVVVVGSSSFSFLPLSWCLTHSKRPFFSFFTYSPFLLLLLSCCCCCCVGPAPGDDVIKTIDCHSHDSLHRAPYSKYIKRK